MRDLPDIVRDAEGFSKTEFRYDPPHALDRGIGTVADFVQFEGRLIAVVDGMDDEDFLHVISDDIEPDIAEPMARLLNDVGPLCAKVKVLRELLAQAVKCVKTRAVQDSGGYWDYDVEELLKRLKEEGEGR